MACRRTTMTGSRRAGDRSLSIASLIHQQTAVKRRRSALDVDGPDTAALSCKKRRLRSHLVTSRLSRPYSQPASYRSGHAAAMPRAGRPSGGPDSGHGAFLKFSVLNRIRNRLGLQTSLTLRDAGSTGAAAVRVGGRMSNPMGPSSLTRALPRAGRASSPTSRPHRATSPLVAVRSSASLQTFTASPRRTYGYPEKEASTFLQPGRLCLDDDYYREPEDVYCDIGALFGQHLMRTLTE